MSPVILSSVRPVQFGSRLPGSPGLRAVAKENSLLGTPPVGRVARGKLAPVGIGGRGRLSSSFTPVGYDANPRWGLLSRAFTPVGYAVNPCCAPLGLPAGTVLNNCSSTALNPPAIVGFSPLRIGATIEPGIKNAYSLLPPSPTCTSPGPGMTFPCAAFVTPVIVPFRSEA